MNARSRKLLWALTGAGAAILVTVTTSALAGSGIGGVFNLGQQNTVDAQSSLSGNAAANPQLRVNNAGTGPGVRGDSKNGIGLTGFHNNATGNSPGVQGQTASTDPNGAGVLGRNTGGGPALRAVVNAGAAPLAVNSNTKVASLNSDLLDGIDSNGFIQGKGEVLSGRITVPQNNPFSGVVLEVPGFGQVWGSCATTTATLAFANTSPDAQAVYVDDRGAAGLSLVILPGSSGGSISATPASTANALNRVIYQVGHDIGANRALATITAMATGSGNPGDCVFQAQAVAQRP
jgi:hypothetical protein